MGSGAGDVLRGGVEEEAVFWTEGGGACCCGVGAEIGLREGYGDGGVGWEVELWVAFPPISVYFVSGVARNEGFGGVVLDDCDVDWGSRAGLVYFRVHSERKKQRITNVISEAWNSN